MLGAPNQAEITGQGSQTNPASLSFNTWHWPQQSQSTAQAPCVPSPASSSGLGGISEFLHPRKEKYRADVSPSINSCIVVVLQQGSSSLVQEAIHMKICTSQVFPLAVVQCWLEIVISISLITGVMPMCCTHLKHKQQQPTAECIFRSPTKLSLF